MHEHPTHPGPTVTRHFVLGWLCIAATIAYVQRNSIAVAEKTIREDLGLTLDQMSWVLSGFFVTYAVFQIPSGWWGDQAGSRRSLAVYSLVWSMATGLLALGSGFVSLLSFRLLGGAGQAGIFPCSAKSISEWYPRSSRAITSGFLGGFMSVGGALGAFLTGLLLDWFSWRWIFVLFALPGIVWSLWFWIWFRDRPEQHAGVNPSELAIIRSDAAADRADKPPTARVQTPWLAICSNASVWWICGQQFFRAAGYMFFASWFATFLQETRGVSTQSAGFLTSLPLLAVVLGSPAGGYLSDRVLARTGSRRLARQGIAAVSMLMCSVLIIGSYFVEDSLVAVSLISLGSLAASVGGPCAYAASIDVSGNHVAAVFSMMNMWGNVGAVAFPPVAAMIVKQTASWDLVLFLFAAMYVAAAICWMFANPDRVVRA